MLQLNEITSPNLRAGQKLLIPIGIKSDIKKFETSRLEFWMSIEEDFFSRYEVTSITTRVLKKGENFWKICTIEQIPIWLFQKCNPEINLASLKPGIKISIPKIMPKTSHIPPQIIPPGDSIVNTSDILDPQQIEEQ